MHPQYKV